MNNSHKNSEKRTAINHGLFVVVIAVSLQWMPQAASANEPVADQIDEIQVTATRRAIDTHDVSVGATIVSTEQVAQQALVTDALRARIGAYVQETTPGQGAAIIRGLRGSAILHLVDGMRLNNAMFRSAPTQYLALVDTGIVDRVEVARGAAASLYGSDAMGGVIQVLSRQPQIEGQDYQRNNNIDLRFDSADLARSIRASSEFGTEALASLVNVSYLDTGNRRIGGGDRTGPSGYRSVAARAAIKARPNEEQSWLLDVQYLDQPATPRYDELVAGFGQDEPSSSEFEFAPNRRLFAHIQHQRDNGPLDSDWTLDFGWQRIIDDRTIRGYLSDIRRHENNRSDLLGLSIRGSRAIGTLDWVYGADWYHDTVSSSLLAVDITDGSSGALSPRFPDDSRINQAAVYANVNRAVGEHVLVSGGLRLSRVAVDTPASTDYAASANKYTDISGELGWSYAINEQWNLVANAGRGFRAPNIFDLGTLGARPGNRFNIPASDLRPEHVSQLDIGIKFDTGDLRGEVMVYKLSYNDRIVSVLTGDITSDGRDIVQSANVAESEVWGVEAGSRWYVGSKLSLYGVVNLSRGTDWPDNEVETPADRMPPLNGRLALEYQLNDSWQFESILSFAQSQTRLSPRDIRDARIDPEGTGGWGMLGIRSEYEYNNGLRLGVAVDNLLDKRYRMHGSGIDARGRGFSLSLQYDW